MRICSHLFSLFGLVGRTMCLKLLCTTVVTWFPTAWLLPSSFYTPGSAADSTIASMIGVMKGTRQALAASIRAPIPGVIYEDLPTLPAAFEAVQLLEVWRLLDLPEGFADDDPRVGYCRQAKAEIASFLFAAEREALVSAWQIRQESGDDQAVVAVPIEPVGL